jgi:hypothetical protein
MAYIGAVMTLPGIAGFVLTMGIGVDFECADLRAHQGGAATRSAAYAAPINAGFSRVFLTLLDTHISALIAALFLIQFGTGQSGALPTRSSSASPPICLHRRSSRKPSLRSRWAAAPQQAATLSI